MVAGGSLFLSGLLFRFRFCLCRSIVGGASVFVAGRVAEENVFDSLLYVLNVVKVANWRGVGGGGGCAGFCL